MVTVHCDWGFRVNTTRGRRFMSRKEALEQGLSVIETFFSTQFLKTFFESSEKITEPTGLKLEFVPLKNPFDLDYDDALPLQVLFEGTPLTDALISVEGEAEEIKTDKEGIAMIKISGKKTVLISAKHRVDTVNNPEMDYHIFTTFLIIEGK